jgi:hypothetical protein
VQTAGIASARPSPRRDGVDGARGTTHVGRHRREKRGPLERAALVLQRWKVSVSAAFALAYLARKADQIRPIVAVGAPFEPLPVSVLFPSEIIEPPTTCSPMLLPVMVVFAMRTVANAPE